MNRVPYRTARIAVTGANFACGSSCEPAVYAFADSGFRCIIAPSFGEIFFSNCFRNGLLPVVLLPRTCPRVRSLRSSCSRRRDRACANPPAASLSPTNSHRHGALEVRGRRPYMTKTAAG
ncbi:MAG: hypothetical protein AABZ67_17405 [Pseudomonadota bacterium]